MTVLRGPADADHFRVKVGRYGDRWYHDPLPADQIAGKTDASWPSVSTIKKASGKDWSFVALKRVNDALEQNPRCLTGPYDERGDKLASINKLGLRRAAARGTNIHRYAEDLLQGRKPYVGEEPGCNYFAALQAWFDQHQPELVACEMVCLHRTLGYGGTADTCVRIDGQTYLVDWKSRGEESDHGGYPEEAAQIAAYARAEYWIAEGSSGPERIAVPQIDGGLIVSIRPDGCRSYPVDLDRAAKHWESMLAWWQARRDERKPVLKPWAPRKTVEREEDGRQPVAGAGPAGPDEDQRPDSPGMVDVVQRHVPPPAGPALDPAALLADIEALPPDVLDYLKRQWRRFPHMANPPSVKRGEKKWLPIEREVIADLIQQAKDACLYATPAETAEQIEEGRRELIERSRRSNDARDDQPVAGAGADEAAAGRGGRERMGAVANTKDAAHTRGCAVDEGPPADPDAVAILKAKLDGLSTAGQNIVMAWLAQAKEAEVPFHNDGTVSVRRFALARACWALVAHMDGDDELVRLALAFVAGDDAVQPAFPTGAIIGALTPEQADRLHEVATGIGERYILGAGRLEAVA
jgi:hypothetical protein